MADTWKAYTDTQALKELAGLRGVAPSVRFLEKRPQGGSKEKIYHVRQNELVYLWGVEMFQGGTDCITIDMINSDGSFTNYKSGGQPITDFISADKMTYNFGLIEYPGFDDFWEDPYLVNYIAGENTTNTSDDEIKKIVKSNFFRAFVFPNEGYYRIVLNERINPLTGSSGFVANYNDDQYTPLTNYYARSWMGSTLNGSPFGMKGANSDNTQSDNPFRTVNDDPTAAPIQSIRTESEFKREIIIKVISSNKDIVDSSTITRRDITFSSGYNYNDDIKATKLSNGKTTFGALNVQGNNAHFASRRFFRPLEFGTYAGASNVKYISYNSGSDTATYGNEGWKALFNRGYNSEPSNIKIMNSDLEFLYEDSDMEYAPICRDLYVGGKLNNGSTTDTVTRNNTSNNYSSSTDEDFRRLRIINARNSIIENLNMYSNISGLRSGEPNFLGPNNWWIYSNTTGDYGTSGRGYVHRAIVDLSGSIIRNCTFEGMLFNALGMFTDRYNQSFIVDGCTFENCIFKGSNLLQGFNGVGVLIKNCKFEQIPKNCSRSDDLIRFYNSHSVCMMGCSVEHQGRFIEIIANGPFTDNIIIRCFDKRRSGQMQAGEGITIDASNSYPTSSNFTGTWPNVSYSMGGILTQYGSNEGFSESEKIRTSQFNGNLCLMNNSIMSSGNSISLHGFIAKGKLNLSAFTNHHYDPGHYLFGRKIDSTASNSDSNIWWHYNVYMHNYSFGGCQGIDFRPNVENNRFLNCIFENPGYVGLDYGNFTDPATGDSTPKRFIYQMSDIKGSVDDSSASPTKNLFNNCTLINYNEKLTKESYESNYWYRNEFSSYANYGLYGQRSTTPVGNRSVKYFKFADDTNTRGSYTTSGGYGYQVNPTSLNPRPSTIFPNNETDAQLTQRLSGGENVIHNLTKIGERYF